MSDTATLWRLLVELKETTDEDRAIKICGQILNLWNTVFDEYDLDRQQIKNELNELIKVATKATKIWFEAGEHSEFEELNAMKDLFLLLEEKKNV